MLTDHLRKVLRQLSELPPDIQDRYAAEIEIDLDERERQRIAAQLADPHATNLDELLDRADEQSDHGQVTDLETLLARVGDESASDDNA